MKVAVVDVHLGILLRGGAAAGFAYGEHLAVLDGHFRVIPGKETGALAAQTVRIGVQEDGGVLYGVFFALAGNRDAAGIGIIGFDIDCLGLGFSNGTGRW